MKISSGFYNIRGPWTTGKLQILQPVALLSTVEGSLNLEKGSPMYVGITPHPPHSLGMDEDEKKKKKKW